MFNILRGVDGMSAAGFFFMLIVAVVMLGSLWAACRNSPEDCIHLYRMHKHKIKCTKCGYEEWKK